MCRECGGFGLSRKSGPSDALCYLLEESLRSRGQEDGPQTKEACCSPGVPNKNEDWCLISRWSLDCVQPLGLEIEYFPGGLPVIHGKGISEESSGSQILCGVSCFVRRIPKDFPQVNQWRK